MFLTLLKSQRIFVLFFLFSISFDVCRKSVSLFWLVTLVKLSSVIISNRLVRALSNESHLDKCQNHQQQFRQSKLLNVIWCIGANRKNNFLRFIFAGSTEKKCNWYFLFQVYFVVLAARMILFSVQLSYLCFLLFLFFSFRFISFLLFCYFVLAAKVRMRWLRLLGGEHQRKDQLTDRNYTKNIKSLWQ